MQKAEPQQAKIQSQPAARQGGGIAVESSQTAQLESLIESSPQMERLGNMAAMMNASPAMAAQRRLADIRPAAQKISDGINGSPLMVAQRNRFAQMFGAVQRVEDKEPLQGNFSSEPEAGAQISFASQKNAGGFVGKNVSSHEALQLMAIEAGSERMEIDLFLSVLHQKTFAMADKILKRINQSADNCPYLSRWFDYYSGSQPEQISKAIRRFSPESAQAKSMEEYIETIVNRVKKGLEEHVETGSTDEVPVELFQESHQPKDFMHIATALGTVQLSCLNSQKNEGGKKDEDKTDYKSIYDKATPVSDTYRNVRHYRGEEGARIIKGDCPEHEISFFKAMSGTAHFPQYYGSKGAYCILGFIGNYPEPAPTAYPENVSSNLDQAAAICIAMAKKGISHNDLDNNLLYYAGQLYVIDFGASRPQEFHAALNSNCEMAKRFLGEKEKENFQKIVNSLL